MIIDGAEDFRSKYYQCTHASEKKEELKRDFIGTVAPQWIGYFENLKLRNEGNWFVGKTVTIADIAVFSVLQEVNIFTDGLVMENETLKKFYDNFAAQPKYASYVKSERYHA